MMSNGVLDRAINSRDAVIRKLQAQLLAERSVAAYDKAAIDRLRAQLNDQQREIAGERARNEVLRDDLDRLQAERAGKDARIERQYAILLEHKSRAERAEAQLASAQNFIDMKGLRKEWAEFLCVSIECTTNALKSSAY
jgi:chromosome segregation ATPase